MLVRWTQPAAKLKTIGRKSRLRSSSRSRSKTAILPPVNRPPFLPTPSMTSRISLVVKKQVNEELRDFDVVDGDNRLTAIGYDQVLLLCMVVHLYIPHQHFPPDGTYSCRFIRGSWHRQISCSFKQATRLADVSYATVASTNLRVGGTFAKGVCSHHKLTSVPRTSCLVRPGYCIGDRYATRYQSGPAPATPS